MGTRPGPEPNQAWISPEPYDSWQLWELDETPEMLRAVRATEGLFNGPSEDPELFGAISGGVFVGPTDDPKKVLDGRLIAATADLCKPTSRLPTRPNPLRAVGPQDRRSSSR